MRRSRVTSKSIGTSAVALIPASINRAALLVSSHSTANIWLSDDKLIVNTNKGILIPAGSQALFL